VAEAAERLADIYTTGELGATVDPAEAQRWAAMVRK